MKQTAVERLVEQLEKYYVIGNLKNTLAFTQAKEMEKQQIVEAWTDGKYCNTIGNEINYEDGDEYYNKTFKGKL
jgi:hypothetical protein